MQHHPVLFFCTVLAAILASAPPGLLNVNAAKVSVEKGKKNGLVFSLGIVLMVMFQVYISVRIAKFLYHNPQIVDFLLKGAVFIFIVLGLYFFFKGYRKEGSFKSLKNSSKRGDFARGALLTSLNFLQIPFYAGLSTVFRSQELMDYTTADEVIFILGAGLGTLAVMYAYVHYFNRLEIKTGQFSKNANYILSGLMLVLTVIALIRIAIQ